MQQSRAMSIEQHIFHMTIYDTQFDRVYSASGNLGHSEQRLICPKVAFVLILVSNYRIVRLGYINFPTISNYLLFNVSCDVVERVRKKIVDHTLCFGPALTMTQALPFGNRFCRFPWIKINPFSLFRTRMFVIYNRVMSEPPRGTILTD